MTSLVSVPLVVRDPVPVEISALVERRRKLGQDLYDEVWEGVLHMNPAPSGGHSDVEWQLAALLGPLARQAGLKSTGPFNLGELVDFRVPDGGLHRAWTDQVWYTTVALAIEIVSPGDETYAKFGFYAARGVEELVIVDPQERTVIWFGVRGDGYEQMAASGLIELGSAELEQQIDWP